MDNDLKIQRKKRLDAACVPDFSRKFNPYDYMEETEINLSELALRITEEKKKEEEQRTRAREFLLIKDEWSEQEVIDLFTHDEVPLMSLICASINTGKLKFLRKYETLYGEPEVYYFEPLVITKWIISKKIPLPNDVLAWYNEQTKQTEERKEEQQIEQVQLKTQSEAPPVKQTDEPKPWLIADPRDSAPKYPWYTPARYFARQLVIADSTLLTKPDILADKVVKSLTKAGIYKRGEKKPFNPVTIKKALSIVF